MATQQNKPTDITKSGPQSFRDLQAQNNSNQGVDPAVYTALMKLAPVISQNDISYNSPRKIQTPIYNAEEGDYYGKSQYDSDYLTDEDIYRFSNKLTKMGVDEKLKEMGAVPGDKVRIKDFYFDYTDQTVKQSKNYVNTLIYAIIVIVGVEVFV